MTEYMQGIDVSVWQDADLSAVPKDFLIARATHGSGFVDRRCDRHVQSAIAQGIPFGVYHFMDDTDVIAQADYFVDNVQGYIGHGLLILDFEEIGGGETAVSTHGDAGARRWLDRVYARTGIKPLIYANSSTARNLHQCAAGDYGLFVAEWNGATGYMIPPEPSTGPFPFAFLHQYTSSGRLPGYNGNLDLTICYGDREAWAKYAGASDAPPAPAPAPAPAPSGTYTVRPGDTLWDIANANGTTVDAILAVNNIANANLIYAGQVINLPGGSAPSSRAYTVASGDTLWDIAHSYGTTVDAILSVNDIPNPDVIHPGQVIRLP